MLYMKIAKHISARMGKWRIGPTKAKRVSNHCLRAAYVLLHRIAYHCRVPCMTRHTLKLHANQGPAHCHATMHPPCHEQGKRTDETAAKPSDFPCLRGIPLSLSVIPLPIKQILSKLRKLRYFLVLQMHL